MVTTITKLLILISIAFRTNADPEAKADPSPIAGVLRISQHIIHRGRKTPFKRCNINSDCEGDYLRCEDGYCKCPSGFEYIHDDHRCDLIGGIGDSCGSTDDCIPPDSSCVDDVCACDTGYVDDGNFCFERTNFGGECERDIQCPDTDLDECRDGNCGCTDSAVHVTGLGCLEILPLLGDVCDHDDQCTFPNAECDTVCACPTDFQINAAEDECVPDTITISFSFESEDDAWDANLADTNSAEYDALRTLWDGIITADPFIISTDVDSYVFTESTDNPGTTIISLDLTIPNPDIGTRKRRQTKSRKRREITDDEQQFSAAVPHSQHTISGNTLALGQFCLQTSDCVNADKTCYENTCT